MELELGLEPEDATRLSRLPLIRQLKSGRARSKALRIVWHDSPDRELANEGLVLAEQRPLWRLERLYPNSASWPPGGPAPVLATAAQRTALDHGLPDLLVPVATFEGRAVSSSLAADVGPVTMTVLNGVVRAVAAEHRISRVRFEGPAPALRNLTLALADEFRLAVPRTTIAAEALAIATGVPPVPRQEGAPELPTGVSVAEAFAHVVGHLSDVFLHLAPGAAEGQDGPEPVHQMRVAVRRLRSAIKVFRRAVRCPTVETADIGLKVLARKLAPTRDWDVFVTETAAEVAQVFAGDKRFQRLLAAAVRRRRTCHDELRTYLLSVEFRRLGIELACLAGSQDWHAELTETEQAELATPLEEFAARVLGKRLKRLVQLDGDLASLEPTELHAVRLRAKRLRYAAEIFAPLYPGKRTSRYIRRLSRLQNELGAVNDAAVAATLLAELPGNHAFAIGLVLGFAGARNKDTRQRIERTWSKFNRQDPFWS